MSAREKRDVGRRRRPWLRWMIVSLAGLVVAVSALAAIVVATGQQDRLYNALFFAVVAKRVAGDEAEPVRAAERLQHFVYLNVRTPPGIPTIDGPPADSLIRGFAYCDPAVLTFLRLIETRGLPGRLLMLIDEDGVSPHSVAEAFIDGAWRVFDTLYDIVPRRADGAVATRQDVVSDQTIMRQSRTSSQWYRQAKIMLTMGESASTTYVLGQRAMTIFVSLAPAWVVDRLQDLYLLSAQPELPLDPLEADASGEASPDEQHLFFRARHYHVFLRTGEAEAAYRELLRRYPESVYADDALYQFGVLQFSQQEDFAAALSTFTLLSERFPTSPWRRDAAYFEARAHEALGHCQAARALYEEIASGYTNAIEHARMGLERLSCV